MESTFRSMLSRSPFLIKLQVFTVIHYFGRLIELTHTHTHTYTHTHTHTHTQSVAMTFLKIPSGIIEISMRSM